VKCGARQIECTVNGIGERAGNCSLEEVVMILKTRRPYFGVETGVNTREIHNASRLVSRLCNMPVQPNKAVVGSNAFSHSSGIHQDGVLKNRQNYEIMTPQSIGLQANRMNLTSRSGSHMVFHRLKELGYGPRDYHPKEFYRSFLALADKKGTVYDDDLIALVELGEEEIQDTYSLEYLNAVSGKNTIPTATVRLRTPKGIVQEAATGDGPVDACYNAIERITKVKVRLEDYKLAALGEGRGAMGKVDVIAVHKDQRYHGTGVSTDIVESSALAILNAVNKIVRLSKGKRRK
jgi:2-isopropylmalate synthase